MRGLVAFTAGLILLVLGLALIFLPPYGSVGLGLLLVTMSTVPFGLSSAASMRSR